MNTHRTPIAACSLRVLPNEAQIRLIPAGRFAAPRGALAGSGPWHLDAVAAERVMRLAAARSTDIPIDYDHQTLLTETNGKPAPAAGWISAASLEWRPDGDAPGLYGSVTWTGAAAEMIAADQYRYLSPVFLYDPGSGAVLELLHVGLTNVPAIDSAALAAASARPYHHPQETTTVTLTELQQLLGLSETTTEADAKAAIAALKAKAAAPAPAATPDPAQYVPISAMQTMQAELAALRTAQTDAAVSALVRDGLAAGKLLPAQEAWAADLGRANIAALRGYLDTAPAIAALTTTQTGGAAPAGVAPTAPEDPASLTPTQLAVCKALRIDPKDFIAARSR